MVYKNSWIGIVAAAFMFASCAKHDNLEPQPTQNGSIAGTLYFGEELRLIDADNVIRMKTITYNSDNLPEEVTTKRNGTQESKVIFLYDESGRVIETNIQSLWGTSRETYNYVAPGVEIKDGTGKVLRILTVTGNEVVASTAGYDGTATAYTYIAGNLNQETSELSSVAYTYDAVKAPFTDVALAGVNEFIFSEYISFTGRESTTLKNNAKSETYSNGAKVTREVSLNANGYPATITVTTQTGGVSAFLLPNGTSTLTVSYKQVQGGGSTPPDPDCTGEGGEGNNFKVNASGHYIWKIISEEEMDRWATDYYMFSEEGEAFIRSIYEDFNDDFDFIIFINNTTDYLPGALYTGIFNHVKVTDQGFGVNPMDHTAKYGSAGKLKGLVHLQRRNHFTNGPSLHELAHYWANHCLNTQFGPHWGITGCHGNRGQLGGFDESTLEETGPNKWKAASFGTSANGGNAFNLRYSDFERYLMGMLDKSQVRPFSAFPSFSNYDWQNHEWEGQRVMVSVDDIISQHGERIPSVATSQKEFKILTVALTTDVPTLLEDRELREDIVHFSKKEYTGDCNHSKSCYTNFYTATYGLGSLLMDKVGCSLKQ